MSTPLQEQLKTIIDQAGYTDQIPTDGRGVLKTLREGLLQGATRAVPMTEKSQEHGASVDIDRENTTRRDRIAPRVQIDIGTYTITGGQPLTLSLPRWVRRVIVQNNTDLGGNSVVLNRSIDGTPATPGDFIIRQGQTVVDDVYTRFLSLYASSTVTINGKTLGGVVVEISS